MKNMCLVALKFNNPFILYKLDQADAAFSYFNLLLRSATLQVRIQYCFVWDTKDIRRHIVMLLRWHYHHIDFDRAIDMVHLFQRECVLVRITPCPVIAHLILVSHLFYGFLYHDKCELILSHWRPLRIDCRHETAKPNNWLHSTVILILYYIL